MARELDYLDCVELMYPYAIKGEEMEWLFREIVRSRNQNIMDPGCECLVSHGHRATKYVCDLLNSDDPMILDSILSQMGSDDNRPDSFQWDESVVQCVENHLDSKVELIRARAFLITAKITHTPSRFADYLCERAAKETPSMRNVCMGALGNMNPIPPTCRPKLEGLLTIYRDDKEYVLFVGRRLFELDHPGEEPPDCEDDEIT